MVEGPHPVDLLQQDHERIRRLLDIVERQGAAAPRSVLDDLVSRLSAHATAETSYLYPFAAEHLGDEGSEMAKQFRLDHEEIAMDLYRLEKLPMGVEGFVTELGKLLDDTRHHLQEEEARLFPSLRSAVGPEELAGLGPRLAAAEAGAPQRPRPSAPKSALGSRLAARVTGTWERWRRRSGASR